VSRGLLLSPIALTAVSLLAVLASGLPLRAEPDMPDPPRSRVKIYDADPITCRPEVIEAGFRSHMAPWADQPEAVQQRLRILQGELTRGTLERCRQKGLMSAEEVKEVEKRLGLTPAAHTTAPQPSTSPVPQPTGSPVRP
jgi:hypothetical protein